MGSFRTRALVIGLTGALVAPGVIWAGQVSAVPAAPATPVAGRIVLVAGSSPAPLGDAGVRALLAAEATSRGFSFEVVDDDAVGSLSLTGVALVAISTSVVPSKVGTTLTDAAVPVLSWEAFLFDDLKLAGSVGEAATTGAKLRIVDPANPLAAGLTGQPVVYTVAQKVNFAVVGGDGHTVAVIPGSPARSAIFEFRSGDDRRDGSPAPSCRVGIFPDWLGGQKLTPKGRALVAAAIDRGLDCVAPPPVDSDGDGVNDAADQCPGTPASATVDANGCADTQKDTDADGVNDAADLCPTTPAASTVNGDGCRSFQITFNNDVPCTVTADLTGDDPQNSSYSLLDQVVGAFQTFGPLTLVEGNYSLDISGCGPARSFTLQVFSDRTVNATDFLSPI